MLTVDMLNQHMPKMCGMKYVAFEERHLDEMQNYGFDDLSEAELREEKQYIVAQTKEDVAFTCLLNDKPICVFGCMKYWDGVAEVWSLISEDFRRFPVHLTKCAIAFIDMCEIAYKLHRVEMTVLASDKRATKWPLALYFKHEAFMEKYSSKRQDFNLFVRINHGWKI